MRWRSTEEQDPNTEGTSIMTAESGQLFENKANRKQQEKTHFGHDWGVIQLAQACADWQTSVSFSSTLTLQTS